MIDCIYLAQMATIYSPAPEDSIRAAECAFTFTFPSDYSALLRCSDGLEPHTERYDISLFSTPQLVEMNAAYQIQHYLPQFCCIGLDGGGRGIFLDCVDKIGAVYLCDMGALLHEELRLIAKDLTAWIEHGFDLKDPPVPNYPEAIDVYLVRAPKNGIRSLYRLLQVLNVAVPVSALREILGHLPYRVLHAVPYFPYAWRCAELNQHDRCLEAFEADRPDRPIKVVDIRRM